MLCMVQDDLTDEHREEQIELMQNVPKWKQRIAGKSLPMEKFAIRKSQRFLDQGCFLVLPALELIYVWHHDKEVDVLSYRDKSFASKFTGTKSPIHHSTFMSALDDSKECFMATK